MQDEGKENTNPQAMLTVDKPKVETLRQKATRGLMEHLRDAFETSRQNFASANLTR